MNGDQFDLRELMDLARQRDAQAAAAAAALQQMIEKPSIVRELRTCALAIEHTQEGDVAALLIATTLELIRVPLAPDALAQLRAQLCAPS